MKRRTVAALLSVALAGCAHVQSLKPGEALTKAERLQAIRRASVWSPTDVSKIDFKIGPEADPSFAPNQWVDCEYKEKEQSGTSPKFTCETSPGHQVKVKYGPRNPEVFGEVLATRLFWALGFPADRMYPVRVRCHGCPEDPKKNPAAVGETSDFDPAAIERKLPGRAMETTADSGWKWSELDEIGPEAGPDARAQRDALKLLAAFIQHTDSKAANQRLLCPAGQEVGKTGCLHPVMMVSDLGLTFGRSRMFDRHMSTNSVSLVDWEEKPVWKDPARCVAQLSRSIAGTIDNPRIPEAGRAFLAGLLAQLSDGQLRDLFENARVSERSSDPHSDPLKDGPNGDVEAWVKVFKSRRAQIVEHSCPR